MHPSQRIHLVEQLRQQGIDDPRLLNAMAQVPRELFVDEALAHQAYQQQALPIGFGQTLSQPYIVAKMTLLLQLSAQHRVLEIGTGSGYQTAILAHLADKVWSIERIKSLQWQAKRRFKQLDLHNIASKHGDGSSGWAAHAPFERILVTAAAQKVPIALLQQLTEGGCLVLPIGKEQQFLYKIVRHGDQFEQQRIEKVFFVPLIQGEVQ